jgi:hypothetical protein
MVAAEASAVKAAKNKTANDIANAFCHNPNPPLFVCRFILASIFLHF